ncbi:TPA: TonB-dependent siderophore receptor [Aeromonas salmonicida]
MLKPHLLHPAALAHPPLAQDVSRFSLNKLGVAARLAILAGVSGTLLLGLAPSAQAQSPEQSVTTTKSLSIPAGSLAQALKTFSSETGISLELDDKALQGMTSPGLAGQYSPPQGLALLLSGHDLVAEPAGEGRYKVRRQAGVSADEVMVVQGRQTYAGGQVASDSRVGLLGNKHFMDTPFNTVSYTEEYIENEQAQDIGSLAGATNASIYVPSKRSVFETFYMRGFSTTASDMTFNGLIGMAPNMRSSTEMAERVDVLKGPSVLLNGMPPDGSVGGSINIVPKRAGKDPLAKVTATYESDGLGGVHLDLGRRFGEEKQWGVRFNGVYRDGDTPVNDQQHKMELTSIGLDWRNERARASLDLYRQHEEVDGVNYFSIFSIASAVTQLPTAKKGDYSLAPAWAYTINDTRAAVLRGEFDLTDSLTAFAAWGQREGGYRALITRNTLLNNAGDINAMAIRSERDGTQRSGEAGLRGSLGTGPVDHAWSLAATHYTSELSFKDRMYPNHTITNYDHLDFGSAPDQSGFGAVTSSSDAKLESVALVDTLSFLDGDLQWTVGARHQMVESTNYGASGAQTSHYDESRLSPATAILVKVRDDLSLYTNYIEGLGQGGTAPTTASNAGEIMKPYQTKQYEVGAKLDLGQFAHTVSLFQIAKPSAYTDPVSNVYGVYGEQRNRGIEWDLFGELTPELRLLGGASYTQAELTKALNKANEGNQATGVPKVMAKLGLEYDLAALPGLTLTGNTQFVGKRYVTDDNRMSLSPYTTFDLGARYTTKIATKEVTVRASVQNLTNHAYWLGSWSGGDGSGLSGGLGSPRTFLLSTSLAF